MSILIGIQKQDYIRYISTQAPKRFDKIVNTLKTFYKTTERVEALINLGNLEYLGLTPYNKCKGDDDIVNCESRIRDRKLSAGKHGAQVVKTEQEFVKKLDRNSLGELNCCFLYQDNKWFILVGAHKESLYTADKSVLKKSSLMKGLIVYAYDPESNYGKLTKQEFYSWSEIIKSAGKKKISYYVFRGDKFLTEIGSLQKIEVQKNDISDI